MDNSDDQALRQRLEGVIRQAAPKPSAGHDKAILDAAEHYAAKHKPLLLRPHFALAATALLAVAIWQAGIFHDAAQPTTQRSAGQAIVWPLDNATLDASPTRLSWPTQASANGYRVTIYDDAANSLFESEWLDANEYVLPTSAANAIKQTGRYFWIVELQGTSANTRLGPYWFTIE
ncbi:MAG: hypothetical protein AAF270_02975 [Pseudomonadota bacterium]